MLPSNLERKTETRQLILQAALQLLETADLQQVTVRKISALAGVNVAAVNYHFGSKDQVILEALQIPRGRFGQAFARLQQSPLPPRERLLEFMHACCETVFAYPNLVKAFINQSLSAGFEQEYTAFIRQEGLLILTQTLAELQPQADAETLRMKAFQLMSSLFSMLLVGPITGPSVGLNFNDPAARSRYIQAIVPAGPESDLSTL
ncbi:MAG TPA: TetR/AcrR family transcriptional regulator [Anaerolineaceae bacterium]|nr:TetR/AcrR family transcriptional regulator [Anaerolineaceae bacterium]HPN52649.1 TetR/AcrR family transcriptional regulator [Anaerolineaceae bacterium]